MSRPRSMLGFPGRTRKSSSGSLPKVDLTESPQEKARYKINTKADPSKAINEAQPAMQAVSSDTSNIASIRSLEHRDNDGNLITDPDASNPTRPRLERPLDTIRSFEAAIDGSSSRRQHFRSESASPLSPQNSRTSYYNGYNQNSSRNTYDGSRGYYYGNRNSMGNFHSDDNRDGYGNYGQYNAGRRFGPRNHSDPTLYGHNGHQGVYPAHGQQPSYDHQGVYPTHGQQPSYDTVNTASNQSHATDQWGNSTNPSSENSSVDKFQPGPPKPDLGEVYGFNGFGAGPQLQGPILEEHGHDTPSYGQPGYGLSQTDNTNGYPYQGNDIPPAVPTHKLSKGSRQGAPSGAPIRLGASSNGSYNSGPPPVPDKREKRKSWLGRRFSRS